MKTKDDFDNKIRLGGPKFVAFMLAIIEAELRQGEDLLKVYGQTRTLYRHLQREFHNKAKEAGLDELEIEAQENLVDAVTDAELEESGLFYEDKPLKTFPAYAAGREHAA